MPRQARVKDNYGIYYINQHRGPGRPIFQSDQDRDRFLSILDAVKSKFNIVVYAYCIAHDDEYHLIINANGSDISNVMKAVNIAYAIYAGYPGQLFRDRYKSRIINDHSALMESIYSIHSRKANFPHLYTSTCFYNEDEIFQTGLLKSEDIRILKDYSIFSESKKECSNCITTIEEAEGRISELLIHMELTSNDLFRNKEKRNEMILQLRRESTLSLKQIGILMGGLSESAVSKIISNH
ncbi:MAG: transposase [Bacillota bacterium]